MASGVMFSVDAARRITRVVKRVEQTPESLGGRNPISINPGTRFWAYIISGTSFTQESFRYGFIKVIPDPLDEKYGWQFDTDVQGVGCVRDPSMHNDYLDGAVVEIEFVGYNADGDPQYWLCSPTARMDNYNALAPHDHRDNFNGGFAFGVMHPGTAIPQQNFSV